MMRLSRAALPNVNSIKARKRHNSLQIIIFSFLLLILLGTFFLMLPIATVDRTVTPFLDAFFTSTASVCVIGMVLHDTGLYWSLFGQIVILVLIQVGGFGVMTVTLFIYMLFGKRISLRERQTIQNSISAHEYGGITRLAYFVMKLVLSVETAGVLLLLPFFCSRYGARGIWLSIFHSISSFCNAGFDIMGPLTGEYSSLTAFSDSIYFTVVISLLIIIGGIGFLTAEDFVINKFNFRQYRMQSKVVLVMTVVLLVVPTMCFFLVDFQSLPLKERICVSFFQTVTARTAGFTMIDITELKGASVALMVILMLVGGAPGSTAGGVKLTTMAVVFANAAQLFKKNRQITWFRRRIDDTTVRNASAMLFIYLCMAVFSGMLISVVENIDIIYCFWETFSAVTTTGMSAGITPCLGHLSRTILILMMFFGRVGGMTIIAGTFYKIDSFEAKYPTEYVSL